MLLMNNHQLKKEQAFTLIELLMVIAIVGILAGITTVSMGDSLDRARIAKNQGWSDSVRTSLMGNRVSEWKLDESSGLAAADTVGTNGADLINGPTWKSGGDCVSGNCLEFDGVNDRVEASGLTMAQVTVLAWVKFTKISPPEAYEFIQLGGSRCTFYVYVTESVPSIMGSVFIGGTQHYEQGRDYISYDKWHLIGFSYDGAKLANIVDGQIKKSTLLTGSIDSASGVFKINARGLHKGFVDEVQIYNAAITADVIREHYLAGLDQLLAKGSITEEEYQGRLAELDKDQDYAVNE